MSWEVLPLLPWFVGAIFSLRFQGAPLFTGVPAISLAGCSLLSIKCGLDYPLSVSAYGKSTLGTEKVSALKHVYQLSQGHQESLSGPPVIKLPSPLGLKCIFLRFCGGTSEQRIPAQFWPHGNKLRRTSFLEEVGAHLRSSLRHYQPRTSLMVQWLRLCSQCRGPGDLVCGLELRSPCCKAQQKVNKNNNCYHYH